MDQLSAFVHGLIVHFGYAGLFVVMVLGNCGLPAGTEFIMPSAGALAATGHLPTVPGIAPWIVVGAVGTLAEIVGGLILYAVGWYGGMAFVHRYGKYVHFREHELCRVHAFYERYGKLTVFWCRFVPFVRGVAALPPGLSRMPKRYFVTFTALGSAIFCFGLAYLGEQAGKNMDAIVGYVHDFGMIILACTLIFAGVGFGFWRQRRTARAAERRPTAL
jgi:membrane protein DedA with SNARE-associated domain